MNTRESLFSFLDTSSSIYYILTDSQGVYTYANGLFRKIFGYLSNDISTREFSGSIHPDDVQIYREAIEECIEKKFANILRSHVSWFLMNPRMSCHGLIKSLL